MPAIRVTPPASEPITIDDLKAHSRIDGTDEDAYLQQLITAAREHVETVTGRALITQTWDQWHDRFASEHKICRSPLQSVTSIQYVDTSGNTQTVSTSTYTVDTAAVPGVVRLAYGQSWPSTRDEANAVTIRFVAGYGDDGKDVPMPIRHAILLLAAHWYEFREAVVIGGTPLSVPMAFDTLIAPYKVVRF